MNLALNFHFTLSVGRMHQGVLASRAAETEHDAKAKASSTTIDPTLLTADESPVNLADLIASGLGN
jgi:hypothetical protein